MISGLNGSLENGDQHDQTIIPACLGSISTHLLVKSQTVTGDDQLNYFFRVSDVISFLRRQWGQPETVSYPPSGGGTLAGRKGIILFEVAGWSDAAGHATLFNGSTCYDRCCFNEHEAGYQSTKAHFWELR